jgi:hypothetical protein
VISFRSAAPRARPVPHQSDENRSEATGSNRLFETLKFGTDPDASGARLDRRNRPTAPLLRAGEVRPRTRRKQPSRALSGAGPRTGGSAGRASRRPPLSSGRVDVYPGAYTKSSKNANKITVHGGESGIRTHGTVSRTHAFQACALSHSAISPDASS